MSSSLSDKPSSTNKEELEKGAVSTLSGLSAAEEAKLTRRVLWKLDTRILPVLALLFLCSFLDRTNVGNARLYGLEDDLGISDHQYDSALAVFYAAYILSEIPSNLILKKLTPKIWLPCLAFVWGISAMSQGFIDYYSQFVGIRILLGMFEGGLLPGIVLYLSGIYQRKELALRIGIFYTAASLSGAFGGLLSRGIAEIGTAGGLSSWRWIFIINGCFSSTVGICSWFLLPNGAGSAKFLTPQEREWAVKRIHTAGAGTTSRSGETVERFQWSEVIRGVLAPQVWLTATAYMGILSGLYSFGLFLPTIITGLGYTANEAQLYSVIPYAVACVFTVITAVLSDRFKVRGIIILFSLPIAIIGYAVIANVNNNNVKYGMTFFMAVGLYSSVPPILGWLSNNSAGHYKRATTSALQLAIANCGGFVAVFVYPKSQGPSYHEGHTIIMSLLCAGWCLVAGGVLYCWKVNKDKAAGKYDQFIGYNDDRDPTFKLVL
ncbi:MFS general substrate transporter [Xylariomycetidae sp. FL2044]|nr:MFS general substrate transporter [Xylariomycetidae sp. FL2044]